MACEHINFVADADVIRLTSGDVGSVSGYVVELQVKCADCGLPFQFRGLPPGYGSMGATCSLDALTANLAIVPEQAIPNPLARMAAVFKPERTN